MATTKSGALFGGSQLFSILDPKQIPGLVGWWDAGSLNSAGTTWYDKSNSGNNATITGTAWTKTTVTGNGSTAAVPVVYGLSTSQALWPAGSIPTNYTFIHVARYANFADHTKSGRIWTSTDGLTGNWLSGFWYGGGSTGVSGVAYHNAWTAGQADLHSGNWVLSTDQPSLYRSNGVTRGTTAYSTYPNGTGQLKINYNNFEISDFHIAEALMFNRILTQQEYQVVEAYLAEKYGIASYVSNMSGGIDPYSNYVTLLARMDGADAGTSFQDWSANKAVGTAVASGTYTPTTSATQYIKGSTSFSGASNNNTSPSTAYAAITFPTQTGATAAAPGVILDCSKDFTVEGWIYFSGSLPTAGDVYFFTSDDPNSWTYSASMNGFRVGKRLNNELAFYFDNGTDVGGPTPTGSGVKFTNANQWYHWAVCKSGGTMRTYIDGVAYTSSTSVGTRTHSQAFAYARIGTDVSKQGASWYIDDVRVTNGIARYGSTNFTVDRSSYWPTPTDIYRKNVTTHLRCENSIADISQKAVAWNTRGTIAYNSGGGRAFGSYCLSPRQGASLSTMLYITTSGDTTVFAPGTGDFTIEGWMYRTATNSGAGALFDSRPFLTSTTSPGTGLQGLCFLWDGTNIAHYVHGGSVTFGTNLSGNIAHGIATTTWTHVALSRTNGTTKIFVGGVQKASYADTNNYGFNTTANAYAGTGGTANTYCRIGETQDAANNNWGSNFDEIRITVGVGRYNAAFTPPTAPFPGE